MPIGTVAHSHLPYCLQKTKDGKWLLLNRDYKPLGMGKEEWVDYDTHPARVAIDGRSLAALKRASRAAVPDSPDYEDLIFFYDDGTQLVETDAGWLIYAKVLKVLAKAKII